MEEAVEETKKRLFPPEKRSEGKKERRRSIPSLSQILFQSLFLSNIRVRQRVVLAERDAQTLSESWEHGSHESSA